MVFPIWLWKPTRKVERQPLASDYHGCCGGCGIETCMRIVICLAILSIIHSGFMCISHLVEGHPIGGAFVSDKLTRNTKTQSLASKGALRKFLVECLFYVNAVKTITTISCCPYPAENLTVHQAEVFFSSLVISFAIAAMQTGKPFHIQCFWIFELISSALGLVLLFVAGVLNLVNSSQLGPRDEELRDQMQQVGIIQIAACLFIGLPINVWILSFVYKYYCYLRDLQIWREQREGVPIYEDNP